MLFSLPFFPIVHCPNSFRLLCWAGVIQLDVNVGVLCCTFAGVQLHLVLSMKVQNWFYPDAPLCDVPLFRAVFVRGTVHPAQPQYVVACSLAIILSKLCCALNEINHIVA